MNIQRPTKIRSYIPLLDREFDSKSPELAALISAHAEASNEDSYMIQFSEKSG